MSGTPRPVREAPATISALRMIEAHVGRSCPTRRDVMAWTGVQRRGVWHFIDRLRERGLIEVEVRDPDPNRPGMPRLRRMRIAGGNWTGWTARFHDRKARKPPLLMAMESTDASP